MRRRGKPFSKCFPLTAAVSSRAARSFPKGKIVRGPFSQILTTKSTKKNKKAQKQFKKFLKRESEGGTTFKMFLPHGRGDMTGSQFGRRRVSRRFSISWEAARLASLLGGGASRVAFGRRCVSRRFWETARLASLLGGCTSRVAFGRLHVSRCFWEAARLASLLGSVASRVAFWRRRVSRRF